MTVTKARRIAGMLLVSLGWLLLLTACNNQYGPPVPGEPLTWGQEQYLRDQQNQNHPGMVDQNLKD